MKKSINFFVFLIAMSASLSVLGSNSEELARKVLDKLYAANGNTFLAKPELKISDTDKHIARFLPLSNKIEIEQKALDLCTQFGADEEIAIAFILGHELAHAFQEEVKHNHIETNFLSFDKIPKLNGINRKSLEKGADLYGAFNAYLAGYNVKKVFPNILDNLYDAYSLKGKISSSYPSLKTRKKTSKLVLSELQEMIKIFESANHLSITGEYATAAKMYDHLLDRYSGLEVYNNASTNYLLAAMHVSKFNPEKFAFPIEFELYTRMKKALKTGDMKDLTPEEAILHKMYLEKALEKAEESIIINKNNSRGHLNKVVAYTLQNDLKKASTYLKTLANSNRMVALKEDMRLMQAIILIKNKKTKKAKAELERIQASSDYNMSELAKTNLEILHGTRKDASGSNSGSGCSIEDVSFCSDASLSDPVEIAEGVFFQFKDEAKTSYYKISTNSEKILITETSKDVEIDSGQSVMSNYGKVNYCKNNTAFKISYSAEMGMPKYILGKKI